MTTLSEFHEFLDNARPEGPALPFGGRTTRNLRQDHQADPKLCVPNSAGYCPCPVELAPESEAELVCSDIGRLDKHLPVFDFDFPCRLVESATPGHFHLYADKVVSWKAYLKVLQAMADAGLIEWGYLDATEERGFASVRHPDRLDKGPR